MSGEEERAKELRALLSDAEHRLHVLEHPVLPDRAFSVMLEELRALEEGGVQKTPDSPTIRIDRRRRSELESHPHDMLWHPLPAVQSVAELRAYHGQVGALDRGEVTYVASATMPGVDLVLTYAGGVLERAILRGDGHRGEDITDNVRTIGSCPLALRRPGTVTESRVTKLTRQTTGPSTIQPVPPYPERLHVRATIAMRIADLTALDRRRVDSGEPPYILPKSAVLGSLRRFDPRITASRPLKLFAIGCDRMPPGIDTEWQLLGALKSWGFAVLPVTWRCRGLPEVLDFVSTLQQIAPTFEYPLEGGTLTVNRAGFAVSAEDSGVQVPAAVRLMFPLPGRPAVVTKVYHAVGRGGAVLPVALLERSPDHDLPVPERAPVPAYDGTSMLAVQSGTTVRVRPGSVAPVIMLERFEGGHAPIDRCPSCQSELPEIEDEPFRTCVNPSCIGRARARLLHLVGPRGLRLNSLSVKLVDKLLAEYGPMDAADLITLDPGKIERIAPGRGLEFAEEIKKTRRMPLWRLLYLVAIPHVSEHVSRAIAHCVFSLERLEELTEARCYEIPDIPSEAAEGLAGWLSTEGPRTLKRLKEAGCEILDGEQSFPAPFLGRRIAVAGDFERGTSFATDEIERRGGIIQPRVGRTTDLLVRGKGGSKEFDAAAMYNIPVIEEAAFKELLKDTS
jgi:DNA ligase (NAD+)